MDQDPTVFQWDLEPEHQSPQAPMEVLADIKRGGATLQLRRVQPQPSICMKTLKLMMEKLSREESLEPSFIKNHLKMKHFSTITKIQLSLMVQTVLPLTVTKLCSHLNQIEQCEKVFCILELLLSMSLLPRKNTFSHKTSVNTAALSFSF